jgi:hypothetical protein
MSLDNTGMVVDRQVALDYPEYPKPGNSRSTALGQLPNLFPPAKGANYLVNSGYPRSA